MIVQADCIAVAELLIVENLIRFNKTSNMSESDVQLDPRANVFLIVNLGCEMLYVIDQRLKAQQIENDKATQVIHDITAVLLEPKFLDSLICGSIQDSAQLLTVDHCKYMLHDIAVCSLMRLDEISMGKLWNLMTMIYKWQLFISKHQHHLMDITFRHLDGISKLYPEKNRGILIDFTKNTLLDFWNSCSDRIQISIYRTNIAWVQCFNIRISVLIRLGFQGHDGEFISDVHNGYFQEFADSIGVNVYEKNVDILKQKKIEIGSYSTTNRMDQLADLLNFQRTDNYDLRPINANDIQKQFEQHIPPDTNLFAEANKPEEEKAKSLTNPRSVLDVTLLSEPSIKNVSHEFVRLEPTYNKATETPSPSTHTVGGLRQELLKMYSKMK